jgi:hypothetical protein
MHPAWALVGGATLSVLSVLLVPDLRFVTEWGVRPFVREGYVRLVVWAVVVALLGMVLTGPLRPGARRAPGTPDHPVVPTTAGVRPLRVIAALTAAGYAAWVLVAISRGLRPDDALDVLRGQRGAFTRLKELFAPVTGITTFSQLHVAVAVLGALTFRVDRRSRHLWFGFLVVAGVRGVLLSERLALIEYVAASAMVVLRTVELTPARRRRLAAVPVVAVLGVWAVFVATESVRSYASSSRASDVGVLEYGTTRLLSYYSLAANNSSILLFTESWDDVPPFFTVDALWAAPVVGEQLQSVVSRNPAVAYRTALGTYGNPEFNSPGGYLAPFVDFGLPLGTFVVLGFGLVMGALYRSYLWGRSVGLLLYPAMWVGLLELPRIVYFTNGRVALPVVALLIVSRRAGLVTRPAPVDEPVAASAA